MRNKGWLYVLFLLCSLIFAGVTHRGSAVSDYVFNAIGIPPWSNREQNMGAHYSTIFALIMLILSASLTIRYFRQRYEKNVGRTVVISCIIFIYVFPFMTEQLYYVAHAKKTGIEVVDFLAEDSRCSYSTQEDIVYIDCTLRIVNYGGTEESMMIRPIFQDITDFESIWSFAEIQYELITLEPRSNQTYKIAFETKPDERTAALGAGGTRNSLGLEFLKDNQKKEIYTP